MANVLSVKVLEGYQNLGDNMFQLIRSENMFGFEKFLKGLTREIFLHTIDAFVVVIIDNFVNLDDVLVVQFL
jgi:hypothetical protein